MNDPYTLLANSTTIQQHLKNTDLKSDELNMIAIKFLESDHTILSALIIFHHILDENDQVHALINNKTLALLQNQDNKIQEITLSIMSKLILKYNYSDLANQIIQLLLATVLWDHLYHPPFKLTSVLMKEAFPDLKNQLKIVEPMFSNRYCFTNQKDRYLQGLLGATELLLQQQYLIDRVVEIIELIQRTARHQNKYVRIFALKFVQTLFIHYKEERYHGVINATIQYGLMDEALEVRMCALKAYQSLNPEIKDQFLIPLLTNCHTENLMEIAANISQEQFPSPDGPPILGLISNIRDKYLKECLIYCYSCTTSRYYQIRCSGLQTLQTTLLFLKSAPNLLPYKEILKVAQNCTLYETDPTVRAAGFSLMYHLIRLHINQVSEYLPQVIENCLFHLSDVPMESKDLCAKILALLKDHMNLVKLLQPKLEQVKNKEMAYQDYVGNVPDTEEAKSQLQKSIESQGGKDKVISRHQSHTLFGIALCFRYIAQVPDEALLKELLQTISQLLKYIDQLRHQILESIVEGLSELKIVKRLPIRLLDETDILQYMKQYSELDLLNRIGEIVGPTVLKGRL